jgi:hypothetical protein
MLEIEIVLSLCLAHTLGYSASSNQALVIEITTFYVFSRSIVKIINISVHSVLLPHANCFFVVMEF